MNAEAKESFLSCKQAIEVHILQLVQQSSYPGLYDYERSQSIIVANYTCCASLTVTDT